MTPPEAPRPTVRTQVVIYAPRPAHAYRSKSLKQGHLVADARFPSPHHTARRSCMVLAQNTTYSTLYTRDGKSIFVYFHTTYKSPMRSMSEAMTSNAHLHRPMSFYSRHGGRRFPTYTTFQRTTQAGGRGLFLPALARKAGWHVL